MAEVQWKSGAVYRREIRDLLVGIQKSNRADVEAFSKGHLNENRLRKLPSKKYDGGIWKSSQKRESLVPAHILRPESPKYKVGEMIDTLKNFSLGTAGNVLLSTPRPPPTKASKEPYNVERFISVSSQGSYNEVDDGVLVEEMGNAETMVFNTKYQPKSWAYEELLSPRDKTPSPVPPSVLKERNLENLRQTFLPSHAMGVTKRDQFSRMKNFEDTVVQKEDLYGQNTLTASKAVEHLEAKLQSVCINICKTKM